MIFNISAYKFVGLSQLTVLQEALQNQCHLLGLKGTILLSQEGINLNLAGTESSILAFKGYITQDHRFHDLFFKESYSESAPFERLKVKIKKEIITMKQSTIRPEIDRAPSITPQEFKQWLDDQRDILVLDTRNEYEVRFGTFRGAHHLNTKDFSEFPQAARQLKEEKPVVTMCTGGIRCEKAALHLKQAGFREVYQLEGGILNYFREVGGDHFDGECYVFDKRIALNAQLEITGTKQCVTCQGPIKRDESCCVSC